MQALVVSHPLIRLKDFSALFEAGVLFLPKNAKGTALNKYRQENMKLKLEKPFLPLRTVCRLFLNHIQYNCFQEFSRAAYKS